MKKTEGIQKMKKIQKLLSLLLAIIMLAGALAGCAGGEKPAADTPKNGQTDEQTPAVDTSASAARDDIVIGLVQEPATLDPNNMSDGGGFMVAANIYEGLLWSTDDLQIEPLLAKSWDISDDGLVYTFHLEEDVKFHNGEPFTAEDCKFSYDRAASGGYADSATAFIDSTRAVDEHTFEVTLKYPYASALDCFASHFLRIVSKKAVEDCGDSFSYNPIGAGTGPYKFISWTSGSDIQLEAFEEYWRGAASIKKVDMRVITDQSTLSLAIETGEVDYGQISGADLETFSSNDKITYSTNATTIYNYVGFNTEQAPFDNALVRQAIAYCCDKNDLALISYESMDAVTVTATPAPAGSVPGTFEVYPKDIEKAKQLLAEAGYADGFSTTIYTPNATWRKNIATYLQSCMAEIGITVNIEVMEQAALLEDIRSGNCPMFIMGFVGLGANADFFYYSNYRSGQNFNYTRYNNPELDALLDAAHVSSDEAEVAKLYKQIAQIVYDEVPDMPTFHINFMYGYNADLNATVAPFTRIYVYDFSWK